MSASTFGDLYRIAREALDGQPMPELEARELTALAARRTGAPGAADLRLVFSEEAPAGVAEALTLLLERRLRGEPLAYLLGEWDFYGLTLRVTKDVLVPRPDTECVTERALEFIKTLRKDQKIPLSVLDLCCGSGCIAIALGKNAQNLRLTLGDWSEEALAVAAENVEAHGLAENAVLLRLDALDEPPEGLGPFALLVCNPPYVSGEEMDAPDAMELQFEPAMALYGGSDGLNFFRAVACGWRETLTPGGVLLFECGARQTGDVAEIMERNGFVNIGIGEDLAHRERMVWGVKKKEGGEGYGGEEKDGDQLSAGGR